MRIWIEPFLKILDIESAHLKFTGGKLNSYKNQHEMYTTDKENNRRNFLKKAIGLSFPIIMPQAFRRINKTNKLVLNPYEGVDWGKWSQYKANLHCHTLQSDGYHSVNEVIRTYKNAGFSILSITDHDWNWPNARIIWKHSPIENASPYPLGPLPKNYPANTTWPWSEYGGPEPNEIRMVGIQGNELTFRHHINSYFSDYGVWYDRTGQSAPYGGIIDDRGKEVWEDDQLFAIRDHNGLAVINHPGIPSYHNWWERKPLEWYLKRFQKHSSDYLLGMEVTNNDLEWEKYDENLWDQLLFRLMPHRPVWGFGNDDMHSFNHRDDHFYKNTHSVFILNELDEINVRKAMVKGHFYFCKSSHDVDPRKEDIGVFPMIESINFDPILGIISIDAKNFDEIKWITAPGQLDDLENYQTSHQPWASGTVIHNGVELNYLKNKKIDRYVRVELERNDNGHTYRTFLQPFGFE